MKYEVVNTMAIYLDIATTLRNEIRYQHKTGGFLPSEQKLANRFKVNRHTVRRAIDELVQDGLIKRLQGVGNQVTSPAIDYALDNKSCFTYNLSKKGVSLVTKVLGCQAITLEVELSNRLNLPDDTDCVVIKTSRSIDNQPTTLIKHHVFGVEKAILQNYTSGSLHTFLEASYQYRAKRGKTRLKARMPTFDECQQLKIGRGIPVMEIHSLYFLIDSGDLMEYSISVTRSDIFEYSVEP
ncbi:GntR family transcriptional regulator [Marinomonas agarivorans]|nr:GntR family transcriptional regulator [Marinomonas agarivorans]